MSFLPDRSSRDDRAIEVSVHRSARWVQWHRLDGMKSVEATPEACPRPTPSARHAQPCAVPGNHLIGMMSGATQRVTFVRMRRTYNPWCPTDGEQRVARQVERDSRSAMSADPQPL